MSRNTRWAGAALLSLIVLVAILATVFERRRGTRSWPNESQFELIQHCATVNQVEAIVGRQPDVIVKASATASKGLDQLLWAPRIYRPRLGQSVDELEAELYATESELWRTPDAILAGGLIHVYGTRDGRIYEVFSSFGESNLERMKSKASEAITRLTTPTPAGAVVAVPLPTRPFSGVADKPENWVPAPHLAKLEKTLGRSRLEKKDLVISVGQIMVVGNQKTRDGVILKVIGFSAGQKIKESDLLVGERNLEETGLFKIDEKAQTRPTIRVIDGDSGDEVKNLLVEVHER